MRNLFFIASPVTAGILFLLSFLILWKGGKSVDATWLFALAASTAGLLQIVRAPTRAVHPAVWWSAFAFVLLTILSYVMTGTRNYGLDEVMHTVSLFILFQWVVTLQSERTERRIERVIGATTLLAITVGIAVYMLQPVSRFVGTFFDYRFHTDYWPNAWAEFLLLSVPILFAIVLRRARTPRDQHIAGLVLGIALASLFLSYSRGAVLCFIAQLLVFVLLVLWRRRASFSLRSAVSTSVIMLASSFVVFFGINQIRAQIYHVESVVSKVTFTADEGTSSVSERSSFWSQSFQLALSRPILGHGPYSFRFVQPGIQSEVLATSDHPHNVLLKYASERGIPAAVAFVLFLLLIGLAYLRRTTHSWFSLLAGIGVFGVLLHNMIDFNLQFLGISFPLFVVLGLLCPVSLHLSTFRFQRIVTVLLSILLLIVTVREAYALWQTSQARHASAAGDKATAIEHFDSVEWAMFSRDDWLTRSILALERKDYLTAEANAQRYIVLNQSDARGFRLLGDIYLAWGQREDALRAYEKAYNRSSRNDLGIARGYATLLAEKTDDLDRLRAEFDHLLIDFEKAILRNSHFVALSKNVEEFDALTRLLARLYPEDRDIYAAMRDRVGKHAEEERSKYRARPTGFLW
ncbi:MAG: O-antigen ligase family protein [Candidatus Peribacteraceae bacterium]